MAFNKFFSGTKAKSSEVNTNFNSSLKLQCRNTIRQLQDRSVVFSADGGEWAEAYTDSNGRLNSVTVSNSTAGFETDKYIASPYVIIAASSLTISDFQINDCEMILLDTGVWQLSASGTYNVALAKIAKTLFYGTNGINARASSTYITGITAITTNVQEWVGKRGHYAINNVNTASFTQTRNYTGTFVDTLTNTDCMSWSNTYGGNASYTAVWEMPNGTALNTVTNGTNNEIGTDTSSDTLDNPATCDLYDYTGGNTGDSCYTEAIIVCSGDITWSASGTGTSSNIDFSADNSIPDFTADSTYKYVLIEHVLPLGSFSSTISSCFGTALVEDWEAGANIQYKLINATEDTGWLNYNEVSEFTAFTSEPTKCTVKLIPKTTSPTLGVPSIKGFTVVE